MTSYKQVNNTSMISNPDNSMMSVGNNSTFIDNTPQNYNKLLQQPFLNALNQPALQRNGPYNQSSQSQPTQPQTQPSPPMRGMSGLQTQPSGNMSPILKQNGQRNPQNGGQTPGTNKNKGQNFQNFSNTAIPLLTQQ